MRLLFSKRVGTASPGKAFRCHSTVSLEMSTPGLRPGNLATGGLTWVFTGQSSLLFRLCQTPPSFLLIKRTQKSHVKGSSKKHAYTASRHVRHSFWSTAGTNGVCITAVLISKKLVELKDKGIFLFFF